MCRVIGAFRSETDGWHRISSPGLLGHLAGLADLDTWHLLAPISSESVRTFPSSFYNYTLYPVDVRGCRVLRAESFLICCIVFAAEGCNMAYDIARFSVAEQGLRFGLVVLRRKEEKFPWA